MRKKIFQILFIGAMLCPSIAIASQTCYCAIVGAGGIPTVKMWATTKGDAGGMSFEAKYCTECQEACWKDVKMYFAYGKCWGQSDKPSNCNGC